MYVRAALMLVLLATTSVAQLPPGAMPPLPALPTQQNDADSGRDAPNEPDTGFGIEPGRIYEGSLTGAAVDQSDYYAFDAPAGSVVEFLVLGLVGCFDIVDITDTSQASGCTFTPAISVAVEIAPESAGTWFFHYHWFTPDGYRFSFGIDAPAPRLGPLDPEPLAPLTQLAAPSDEPVVVAVIDTGVNPYHQWFAAPEFTAHPSSYLAGFPADATPLHLSLDAPDYASARAADREVWQSIPRAEYDPILDRFDAKLYTIPGTRIIGAVSFGEFTDALTDAQDPPTDPLPVLDDNSHGTLSAALAGGAQIANALPDVLLVIVEVPAGGFEAGLRWAARQEYVDIVSFSMGRKANIPAIADNAAAGVAEVVAAGKAILVASGNGLTGTATAADRCSTYTSPYTGPPGVTRIGAAVGGEPSTWHCTPVDAIAATNLPSARHDSLDERDVHTGTSAAAPQAAAHLANLLVRARQAGVDVSPSQALQHLLAASAPPTDQPLIGAAEHGYGRIDAAALERAWASIQQGTPSIRRDVAGWLTVDRLVRQTVWQADAGGFSQARAVSAHNDAGSGADAGDVPAAALFVAPGEFDGRLEGMALDAHDWYAFEGPPGQAWSVTVRGAYGSAQLYDSDLNLAAAAVYDPLVGAALTAGGDDNGNGARVWYLHVANEMVDNYHVRLAPIDDAGTQATN